MLKENKNLHLTHVEDLIFHEGLAGAHTAINFLRDTLNFINTTNSTKINVTTKWDGSLSIFAGIDPTDGEFFVSKKGIFNKTPKVYKTNEDIDFDTKGELADKLKIALHEFKKLGIRSGVYQGDILFLQKDLKTDYINGNMYLTFHPNTIIYAVRHATSLWYDIFNKSIGVVWHTRYTGDSFETMKCSFDINIKEEMKKVESVWAIDSNYYTHSDDKNKIDHLIRMVGSIRDLLNSIDSTAINSICKDKVLISLLNTYINKRVKSGKRSLIINIIDFINHIDEYFQKEINTKVKLSTKINWETKRKAVMEFFVENKHDEIIKIFDLFYAVGYVKLQIIDMMDRNSQFKTFVKNEDWFLPTNAEGYVISDKLSNKAVKFVNRVEFSRYNFSDNIIKGFDRN